MEAVIGQSESQIDCRTAPTFGIYSTRRRTLTCRLSYAKFLLNPSAKRCLSGFGLLCSVNGSKRVQMMRLTGKQTTTNGKCTCVCVLCYLFIALESFAAA